MAALIWREEFDGPAGAPADPLSWIYQTGLWGHNDGELQDYTASAGVLDGASNLAITASINNGQWESARLVTKGLREFTPPVRILAKIKLPAGSGILPAFWLLGNSPTVGWPGEGEIDVVESPQKDGQPACRAWLPQTVHAASTVGKPQAELGRTSWNPQAPVDLSADWHVFGVTWFGDRMIFTLDARVQYSVTKTQFANAGGDWSPFDGRWPFYLILNVAVGGSYCGLPGPGVTSQPPMLVDWVRVWSL